MDEHDPESSSAPLGRRLAAAVQATSAAILLLDARGRVEHANPASCRLLGQSEAALSERPLSLVLAGSDEAGPVARRIEETIATGTSWEGEITLLDPRGEARSSLVGLHALGAEGAPAGFVACLFDVSARARVEEELREANRRLSHEASRDALTGLYNRRHFHDLLLREVTRSRRYRTPLAVVMVDLDHFKGVNDEAGHVAGDAVLADVAGAIPEGVRDGDVVARWGGDEFVILFPNTDGNAAKSVAERLVAHVRSRRYGPEGAYRLTASVGVTSRAAGAVDDHPPADAELPADGDPDRAVERALAEQAADALVAAADRALVQAKREGGDRVIVAP